MHKKHRDRNLLFRVVDTYRFLTARTSLVQYFRVDAGVTLENDNKVPTLNEAFDASCSNCKQCMESWFMMQ